VEVVRKFADRHEPDHEFVLSVNVPYSTFMADPHNAIGFVQRLAKSMQQDDADTSLVQVNSIVTNPNNPKALLVSWSNASLLESGFVLCSFGFRSLDLIPTKFFNKD